MLFRWKGTLALLLWIGLSSNVFALPKVHLTSLDWPPYTGSQLPDGGILTKVAKQIFKEAGYELQVEFYPWNKAIQFAMNDPKYSGYFPEYYSKDVEERFIFSLAIAQGALGFAERIKQPVTWSTLNTLKPYRIGVVDGYVNTPEFDHMVASGGLKVVSSFSDTLNLLKLASGRINLAVIDKNVFDYLMTHDHKFRYHRQKLRFNPHELKIQQVYFCLRRSTGNTQLVKQLDLAIRKLSPLIVVEQAMVEFNHREL